MDKILEGILCSNHSLQVKTAIIDKVVQAAENTEMSEEQCQALFALTAHLILLSHEDDNDDDDDASSAFFQRTTGVRVLEAYAGRHQALFQRFFTRDLVLHLLQQGYGPKDRRDPAVLAYVHLGLRLLEGAGQSSSPLAPLAALAAAVRTEVLRMVCERPGPALCACLCTFFLPLSSWWCILPEEEDSKATSHLPAFSTTSHIDNNKVPAAEFLCLQLVRTMACFSVPSQDEGQLEEEYVGQVGVVAALLQNIWAAQTDTLLPSLWEVFAVISSPTSSGVGGEPSVALASLVQYVPPQTIAMHINSLIAVATAADRMVADAGFTRALCRMVDWLSWPGPGGQHVDAWVVALMEGLAEVGRFEVLAEVTLRKVEQVFEHLRWAAGRRGAMVLLTRMLMSFRHSPEAFHLVVPRVVPLVSHLRWAEDPTTLKIFLPKLAKLLHCVMYLHPGFPQLYAHIREAIEHLPKPSNEWIKRILSQQPAWTSRSHSDPPAPPPPFPGSLRLRLAVEKSETGRTGLVNLGNTCYMNSIIQTLFMATDFRRRVLSLRLSSADTPLMTKLQLLFAFLAHTRRAAYAPRSFVEASRPPWFNAGSQQDCSEYLRFLLDRLHEEEKSLRSLESSSSRRDVVISQSNDATSKDPATAGTHLNLVETKPATGGDGRTLIETMFRGRLSTSIRCLRCNSVSKTYEPFTDLSLAFCPSQRGPCTDRPSEEPDSDAVTKQDSVTYRPRRPLSVQDMVKYFLAPEVLEAENAYFCTRCGSEQRAEKAMRVVAAPEYLILTLVRFSYDASVSRKILDNVTVPPLLRLPVHDAGTPLDSPATSPAFSTTSALSPALPAQGDDCPERSGENPRKKLKLSPKDEEEEENAAEELVERSELTSKGGEKGGGGEESSFHSVSYVLNSVAMHSGMSSESGHYYSYGRNVSEPNAHHNDPEEEGEENEKEEEPGNGSQEEDDLSTTPKQVDAGRGSTQGAEEESRDRDSSWLLFNDSRVTFTNFGLVQNVTERSPLDTAYVLLYRKQRTAGGGGVVSPEPPLQKELLDVITKDNKLYLLGLA